MIDRRTLIGTALAVAASPYRTLAEVPRGAEAALAAAAAASSAAERVRLLEPVATTGLSEALRVDVEGALAGARVEAEIERLYPFAGAMGALNVVSPTSGAWRSIGKAFAPAGGALATALDAETDQIRAAAARRFALPTSLLPDLLAKLAKLRAGIGDPAVSAALDRQSAALEAAGGPAGDGLWRAPDGERFYAISLALQTGEEVDPRVFRTRMAALVESLSRQADALLRAEGLTQGSVADRFRALARDPRFLYPDDDTGRDRAVADMNRWLEAARGRLPVSFSTIPPAAATVRARRMSAADEAAGRAGYRIVPDAANGFDGGYFVDLSHIRARPDWTLRSVVHHELLPGHMIQLPLQAAAHPHSLRLRYAPGFVEGWGIYAEQLADEDGAFATDRRARLGYLQWMLFRAGRALIDSGIHLDRWSIAEATARLTALQGDPAIFAPFAKDAARASLEPAGFAGQAWTWQAFAAIAHAAGPPGSAARRQIHDRILQHGAMPLRPLRSGLPGAPKSS